MGATTEIAWTDATWNPVVGCTPASTGCAHCYARELHEMRHRAKLAGRHLPEQYAKPFSTLQCFPKRLEQPMRWKSPRRIFVCSTADLFHPDVPDSFIAAVFGVMAACPQHTFQVLTKRAERMAAWFKRVVEDFTDEGSGRFCSPAEACRSAALDARQWRAADGSMPPGPGRSLLGYDERWPLPNVWLGVTVEDQRAADERIPLLLQAPAAVRFLSCEPLVGAVDLDYAAFNGADSFGSMPGLGWVIVGGESGGQARPFDLAWARDIVSQCRDAGVACFVKQLGRKPVVPMDGPTPSAFPFADRDGRDPDEWPEDLRVREFPKAEEVG